MLWHKREAVTGGRQKLHNKELHNPCSSSEFISKIKSRRLRCEWPKEKCMKNFDRITCRKETRGRPRHGWVVNIKMNIKEIGCEYVEVINFVQARDQ